MPLRTLPTFKGYTVDAKLRQFRSAKPDKPMEFIAFDSAKGRELLQELAVYGLTTAAMVLDGKGEWVEEAKEGE